MSTAPTANRHERRRVTTSHKTVCVGGTQRPARCFTTMVDTASNQTTTASKVVSAATHSTSTKQPNSDRALQGSRPPHNPNFHKAHHRRPCLLGWLFHRAAARSESTVEQNSLQSRRRQTQQPLAHQAHQRATARCATTPTAIRGEEPHHSKHAQRQMVPCVLHAGPTEVTSRVGTDA